MSNINEQENELVVGPVEVLESAAGYYIGRYSNQGPYDRLSDYYKTQGEAEKALPWFKDEDEQEEAQKLFLLQKEEEIFEIAKEIGFYDAKEIFAIVLDRINKLPF